MKLKVKKRLKKWMARASYAIGMVTIVWPALAYATTAGGTLPWDPTLTTLSTDMQGPVATSVVTMSVIGTGLLWGTSEHGTGIRKLSSVAFGGALGMGGATAMNALFGAGALF
jgi:type IV secretory pathway VirB2 component (pilin)